jgi:hypothetical protein
VQKGVADAMIEAQKIIQRTSQAIVPHYEAMAPVAQQATGGDMDATPWYGHNALQGLWSMTTETVAY